MDSLRRACNAARVERNHQGYPDCWTRSATRRISRRAIAAVESGVPPLEVYLLIASSARTARIHIPARLEQDIFDKMSPDTMLPGGKSVFHATMSRTVPPSSRSGPAGTAGAPIVIEDLSDDEEEDEEKVQSALCLDDWLAKVENKGLVDSDGNTVMHLLAYHSVNKLYFSREFPHVDAFTGQELPDPLAEEARAEYLEAAVAKFVEAGYSPSARNHRGQSAVDILRQAQQEISGSLRPWQTSAAGTAASRKRGRTTAFSGDRRLLDAIETALTWCGYGGPQPPVPQPPQPPAHRQPPQPATPAAAVPAARTAAPAEPGAPARRGRVPTIGFGMYAGTPLDEVPPSYIRWMCSQADFFNGTVKKTRLRDQLLRLGLVQEVEGGALECIARG